MAKIQVPASEVRAFLKANPSLVTDAARASVNGRGRLHPEAREAFNTSPENKGKREYAEGNPATMTLTYPATGPKGRRVTRKALLPKDTVRALAGDLAGQRGPLSKAAITAAAEAYAKGLKG